MTLKQVEALAADIADKAALLAPQAGDKLIREEAAKFPANLRRLLITSSAKFAEQARLDAATNQHTMDLENQRVNNGLKTWGARVGVIALAVALVVVLFLPNPTSAQWLIVRLIASMGAAGFASALSGFLEVKAKWGIVAIIGGGGLAVFWLTYFWNPPALPVGP